MNLIAHELGIRGHPLNILSRFLAAHDKVKHQHHQLLTLQVNQQFGFIYADGSHLSILEQFYLKKSGLWGAFVLGLSIVASFFVGGPLFDRLIQPQSFVISSSKPDTPRKSLANIGGTISSLPLGIPLLPLVDRYPGTLQFTLITCPKKKLLWYLPLLMLKHKEGNSLGKYILCEKKLQINFAGKTKFTLDGEIYSAPDGRLTIETGPYLDFIKP